ncbi:hypothetical protein P3S67_008856 [Capsicum chacoense]
MVQSSILEGTPVEFLDCKSVEGSESSILVETPVEPWENLSSSLGRLHELRFPSCNPPKLNSRTVNQLRELKVQFLIHHVVITALCDHYQYLRDKLGEKSAEMGSTRGIMKKKILEDFLKELDLFDNLTWDDTVEEKKTESKGTKFHKVKDWKRTLACKFYEERHSTSDSTGEGMDLLWEKYEMDSIKNNEKRENKKKKKLKKKEEHIEQLCCLHALKLSAGKMNLGMGRSDLVRISKAIKGFKWLHHVIKNNKKVHCGDKL